MNYSTTTYSIRRQLRILYEKIRLYYLRWFTDDMDSSSQSLAVEESHLPRLLRLTVVTLSSATLIFIIWAAMTPVKELVRAEGQVLPSGYSRIVQHLEGGLVQQIFVHEGDFVQKDQVLLQLNGAGSEEDYHKEEILMQLLGLQSERLHALLDNRQPDFSKFQATPEEITEQQQIFDTARASQASERQVLEEQIEQKKTSISRLQNMLGSMQSNLSLSQESSHIYDKLQQEHLVAYSAYLQKKAELNGRSSDVSSLTHELESAKRELDEYQMRRINLALEQRNTIYSELQTIDTSLTQSLYNLKKRQGQVSRLEVRAPIMGYVKGMRVNTIGSVIPAGQTLMEIIPIDDKLVVEVRILPTQIGRMAIGQEVRIKVDSFDYVRFGTITGKIESISAMTFTDELRRQDYYKARISLSKDFAGKQSALHHLLPGMTVNTDIVTGEKSVLGYLLKPIQMAMKNALTEQ